jgi:cobalt-precorrin 5A hydrolase
VKRVGIWLVRKEAKKLGSQLQRQLNAKLYLIKGSNKQSFAKNYWNHRQWIFIGTTGIAVRYLQGLPKDKKSDPSVVVVDESGSFAISLLGGHEGGANELAYQISNFLGATPIITTATEVLKPLVIGIGCRKGVSVSQIDSAIKLGLRKVSRSLNSIREVVTIDLKARESGLLKWCKEYKIPLRVIRRDAIKDRSWVTKPSDWVRENIGVDGVCEPCSLIANPKGKLLLRKTAKNGVAIAIVG